MAYFECIIGSGGGGGSTGIPLIVTCDAQFAGSTITATKSGAATQTAICPSSSPYQVTLELPEDGTWTVSGVASGQTFSEVVTITPYSVTLNAIPEGATVTPTDVIQTWLHCAGIFDKSYTTINQVLSDTTTLLALISSNNAVDYMARSTTWATSVCANSTAMTYIGNNNYCANSLLNVTEWRNAICNSSYFENVLNVKVPTMTSNTTPSGTASADKGNAAAYEAFDGSASTYWTAGVNSTPAIVYYQFTQNVTVYKAQYQGYAADNTANSVNVVDGSGNSIASASLANNDTLQSFNFANSTKRAKYGLKINSMHGPYESASACTVQFYGRA